MIVSENYLDVVTMTSPMRTYVYVPAEAHRAADRFPGLILYSEIFQQTEPIRRLATQFAGQGYVVMVPEIYHDHEAAGTVLGYDTVGKDKGNAYKYDTPLTTFDNDARSLLAALREHPQCNGRFGAVGFCLGGHLAFRAALQPEVRATSCFYATDLHSATLGLGKSDDSLRRAAEIRGELLFIWGRQDPHVPVEGRRRIFYVLHQAGTRFTWHEFNCEHAFMRDEGNRFDPAAARLGLGLAFELFHRAL